MFILPIGPDWADGKTSLPPNPLGSGGGGAVLGTPTPDGAVIIDAGGNTVSEVPVESQPDSPEIERAEQGTFQQRLTMSYDRAISYLGVLGRGTFVADSGNGFGVQTVWRILSSKVRRLLGNTAELSYSAESISFDSPPDEYDITTTDLGLDLLKHPRYAWALSPIANDNFTHKKAGDTNIFFTDIKSAIIRMIQTYRDAPVFPSADGINGLFHNNIMSASKAGLLPVHYNNPAYPAANTDGPGGPKTVDPVKWNGVLPAPTANCPYFIVNVPVDLTDDFDPIVIALAAAREIISLLWLQEDTPYIPSFQVTLSRYFFRPVYHNGGGYVEDPVGIVPDYFMDPNQDGSDNIFSQLSNINPQLFAADGKKGGPVQISWLRKADHTEYQRTWFKVTMTWEGAANGVWNPKLYTTDDRPQKASDFSNLI